MQAGALEVIWYGTSIRALANWRQPRDDGGAKRCSGTAAPLIVHMSPGKAVRPSTLRVANEDDDDDDNKNNNNSNN